MFQVDDLFVPLIKIMSEAIEKKANSMLKEYGVTSGQLHILIVLSMMDKNECKLKELEKVFSFSQAAIAATVARMEVKGLVNGYIKEEDKRIKYARLTIKGKEIVKIAQEKLTELNEHLLEGFTEEEHRILMGGLRKIYKKLI